MPSMNMERTGHNHAINVVQLQQASMIIQGLNAWRHLLRLVAAACVHIGDGYELGTGHFKNLLQQLLTTASDANHSYAHPVIRAKHSRAGVGKKSGCD